MSGPKENDLFQDYCIDDSVGYLLGRVRTKLAKALDVALAEHGITHAQGSILLMLGTGKYQTAADLVRDLYIDSASMTRMIDRLEKRGVLTRERSAEDRRVARLCLTADGRELAGRLPGIYAGVLNREFGGFSPQELGTFRGLLRKVLANETPAGKNETAD